MKVPLGSAVPAPAVTGGRRVEEAWRWLSGELGGRAVPPLIVVVGLGHGEVLEALARHAPSTRVLALEPDPGNARTFLSGATWERWRDSGKLAYLAGPAYAGADEAWRLFADVAGSPPVLLHPELALTPDAGHAAQVLKKILVGVSANREARRKFAPRYLVNSIRNLPAIIDGADIRCLSDAYRGLPAVIAAAGPSLDAALPQLRDVRDRALFIACDTALRPCLTSGIAPHLVVGVDPGASNARHMLSLPECPDTWLVAESALDRRATAVFDKRTFWFHVSDHEPWPWFGELGLDVGQVDVWGSVLTAAFQTACLAGCDPIVIVGADLAFTDGRPYARGTTYDLDWAKGTAAGASLDQVWSLQASAYERLEVADINGHATRATPALVSFRDWLVARAGKSGRRVINASGAGIFAGPGVEQGTLDDVLSRRVQIPRVDHCARRHAGVSPSKIVRRLRDVQHMLEDGARAAPLVARWRTFSGEGFDHRAIATAVDEAARGLESKRSGRSAPFLIEWTRLGANPSTRALIAQLPEALARFRAATSGAAVLPPAAGADVLADEERRALLVEALRLIDRIQAELERSHAAGPTRTHFAATPLSAGMPEEWPDELRWAVEIVEGLLGLAWKSADAVHPLEAIFTAPVVPRDSGEACVPAGAGAPLTAADTVSLLIRRWFECCASVEDRGEVRSAFMRLAGLAKVGGGSGQAIDARLKVAAGAAGDECQFELPLRVRPTALGRVLTGALRAAEGRDDAALTTLPGLDGVSVRVSISRPSEESAPEAVDGDQQTRLVSPRLLGRPGERWTAAYATDAGVVCVRANSVESVLVRPNGAMSSLHHWPRPIVCELRLPDGGLVAWGTGRALAPPASPYVMYRHAAGEVIVEDLPFTPSWGGWHAGRVYWNYLPSAEVTGRGLGSWAPGKEARVDFAGDLALFGLRSDGEQLLLDPATRRPDFAYERRLLRQGWQWHPLRGLESRTLGPNGSAGSVVIANGWTTTTFPEADLVTFEHVDGRRRTMTVYHPFRAFWSGASLVVATVDYRLLMFEDLLVQFAD